MSLHKIITVCNECKLETERNIDKYIEERETLKAKITELEQRTQTSEAMAKLLDLLEPYIERKERLILHDEPELVELIQTYREIRPR